jgi:hypothetical protein
MDQKLVQEYLDLDLESNNIYQRWVAAQRKLFEKWITMEQLEKVIKLDGQLFENLGRRIQILGLLQANQ